LSITTSPTPVEKTPLVDQTISKREKNTKKTIDQTIKKDLELNGLNVDMVHDRA